MNKIALRDFLRDSQLESSGDIESAVERFTDITLRVLGSNAYALYLSGSLTSGDFDKDSSDIDFMVITRSDISLDEVDQLKGSYRDLRSSGNWWDSRTEGIFLPRAFCQEPTLMPTKHYVLKTNGEYMKSQERSDWIVQLKLVEQSGVRLGGDGSIDSDMMVSIGDEQIKQIATMSSIPFVERPDTNNQPMRTTALHVLSVCRVAYTNMTGEICSKVRAADWATQIFPDYADIIRQAIRNRGAYEYGPCYDAYDFIDVITNTALAKE